MAQDTQLSEKIAKLIAESELSRSQISASYWKAKRLVDFPIQLRKSFEKSSNKWIAGSVLAGIGTTFLFPKKRAKSLEFTPAKKHSVGLVGAAASFLFPLLKPIIKDYALKLVTDSLKRKSSNVK